MRLRFIVACVQAGILLVCGIGWLFQELGSMTVGLDDTEAAISGPYTPAVETFLLGREVEVAIDALADPLVVCGDPDGLAAFKITLRDRAQDREATAASFYRAWARLCEGAATCDEVRACAIAPTGTPRAPSSPAP